MNQKPLPAFRPDLILPPNSQLKIAQKRVFLLEEEIRERALRETGIFVQVGSGKRPFAGFINVDRYVKSDCKADMKELPFRSASVDVLWSFHSFEHMGFKDCRRASREFTRIVKPGGSLFISIPDPQMMFERVLNCESNLRSWYLRVIYGYQQDGGAIEDDSLPLDLGQFHLSAWFPDDLVRLFSGFRLEIDWPYDSNGTPARQFHFIRESE